MRTLIELYLNMDSLRNFVGWTLKKIQTIRCKQSLTLLPNNGSVSYSLRTWKLLYKLLSPKDDSNLKATVDLHIRRVEFNYQNGRFCGFKPWVHVLLYSSLKWTRVVFLCLALMCSKCFSIILKHIFYFK